MIEAVVVQFVDHPRANIERRPKNVLDDPVFVKQSVLDSMSWVTLVDLQD